jgi:hypothetical protein
LLTQTCWCVYTQLCQCHLELEGDKKLSSSYLDHFSSLKSFNHITKDANVFHLKSGNSCWLSYIPTFTTLKHTSHHHGQFIASHQFLTSEYGRPFTSGRLWTSINFHNNFEPTWHPHFSLFLYFPLLYIFLIYDVFLNKDL